jgi:hypothetical protein
MSQSPHMAPPAQGKLTYLISGSRSSTSHRQPHPPLRSARSPAKYADLQLRVMPSFSRLRQLPLSYLAPCSRRRVRRVLRWRKPAVVRSLPFVSFCAVTAQLHTVTAEEPPSGTKH